MGWFKKAVDKVVDPFLPESVKKTTDKFVPEAVKQNDALKFAATFVNPALGALSSITNASILAGYSDTSGGGKAAEEISVTGRLTEEEAATAAAKRLARASKYFTSALGDLSPISTAMQKVFS